LHLIKKTAVTTFALILMISMSIVVIPIAIAHDPPWTLTTFAYISIAPQTIGVNQQMLVYMWLQVVPPTASGDYGDRWHDFTLEITRPDGTVETKGGYDSDPIGFASATYTPTQVGEYQFKFIFPGQTIAGENLDPNDPTGQEYIGDYYKPSESEIETLTVQEDPVPTYPATPLPPEGWSRPIDANHRDWWSIAGNWLNAPGRNWAPPNGYAPYTNAPATSHILWAKELTFGGLVGGEFVENSFHCGNAYEGKWVPPVIIAGRLYYNKESDDIYAGMQGRTMPGPGVYCVDLRTGEEIWYTEKFRVEFGQIYMYNSPNQHGALAYLWEVQGSTWNCYDAYTTDWVYTIENVPGGTHTVAPDGSIYRYQLSTQNDRLTVWSNTAMPELQGSPTGTGAWQWRPGDKVVDASSGYILNVTIPSDITGGINRVFPGDKIIGSSGLGSTGRQYIGTEDYSIWCLSLESGREGIQLWKKDGTGDGEITLEFGDANAEDEVFTMWSAQTRQHWGYDLNTGNQIWGPTESQAAWDMTVGTTKYLADGKLICGGYAGIAYCYDSATGELEWTYKVECPYYLESKWGSNYIIDHILISDGKVFLFCGEHSPDDPKERGSPIACVDIETGEELWVIPFYCGHWAKNPAIADGILVFLNTYDNRIYGFGPGDTKVTVEAPLLGVPSGCSVMIRGTVTDQSSGAVDSPAISDEDMDQWMQYLYMQYPMPTGAKGVDVTIDVIDGNGNYRNIGSAVSDINGFYSMSWMPDIPGKYTVIATFEGSDSYWSSYSETAFVVDEAVSEPAPDSTPAPMTDTYVMGFGVAILVLVAIIGIVLIMMMRKK